MKRIRKEEKNGNTRLEKKVNKEENNYKTGTGYHASKGHEKKEWHCKSF